MVKTESQNLIFIPNFYQVTETMMFNYRMRAIISRGLYIFGPFFTTAHIVERLVLQTIYVLNKVFEPNIRL